MSSLVDFSKDQILKSIIKDDVHFCECQLKCTPEWCITLSTCQNISCLLEKDAHLISADETGSIPVSEKFTQLLHFNWIRLRITVGNS